MNTLLLLAVPLLFFGTLACSVWYVDSRLRTLFRRPARWPVRLAVVVTVVGMVMAIAATATSKHVWAGAIYLGAGYLLTFHLFLLLALLLQHLAQRFAPMPQAGSAVAALLFATVVTVIGANSAGKFELAATDIQLTGLKQDLSVMHISDVHLGHHRGADYLQRIVDETNRRQPDLVLITGDLVDADVAVRADVLAPLAGFSAPVYYVGGNHENEIDTAGVLALLKRFGVHALHNELRQVQGVQLIGLDYMKADDHTFDMHPAKDQRTIAATLAALPHNRALPTILLHHSPVGLQYAEAAGVNLMLAGHTHGGQLFPATLFAALIFPYNHGLYQHGKMQVFVSQGVGTFLQRIRLGSANQLDLLRLHPAS
jgi:predicted MPP superfamily phosphohydrolase